MKENEELNGLNKSRAVPLGNSLIDGDYIVIQAETISMNIIYPWRRRRRAQAWPGDHRVRHGMGRVVRIMSSAEKWGLAACGPGIVIPRLCRIR